MGESECVCVCVTEKKVRERDRSRKRGRGCQKCVGEKCVLAVINAITNIYHYQSKLNSHMTLLFKHTTDTGRVLTKVVYLRGTCWLGGGGGWWC